MATEGRNGEGGGECGGAGGLGGAVQFSIQFSIRSLVVLWIKMLCRVFLSQGVKAARTLQLSYHPVQGRDRGADLLQLDVSTHTHMCVQWALPVAGWLDLCVFFFFFCLYLQFFSLRLHCKKHRSHMTACVCVRERDKLLFHEHVLTHTYTHRRTHRSRLISPDIRSGCGWSTGGEWPIVGCHKRLSFADLHCWDKRQSSLKTLGRLQWLLRVVKFRVNSLNSCSCFCGPAF